MKYSYPASFYAEKSGQYSVFFPDFGGATYGNNFEDARTMAEDYLYGIISDLLADGESIPLPSNPDTLKIDGHSNGFIRVVSVEI